jgi:pyruvate, orthophosphate dikinase
VQENRLWMLQCRTGKRTGKAAVKIAVDLVSEGLVDTRSAIKMVDPGHLDQLLHPQVCNLIIICKRSQVGIRTTNSIQH